MKFFSTLAIAALATSAVAAPSSLSPRGKTCGNNQKVMCCNVSNSPQKINNGGGFLGIFSLVLAPQGCQPISLPIWGGSFQQLCGNNVAQCCDNNQSGFININLAQCNAIPL